MTARREWRSRANCLGTDPELFFPAVECGPAYEAQVDMAKAVCARCPVRAECLAEALVRMPYGIAGGLTAEERRIERPRRRVVARPGRPSKQRAVGLTLLSAGKPVRDVARCCGVSERTAQRWAITVADPPDDRGEESHGGNRAPLQISPTPSPLAGTRTQEGPEL